MCDDIASLRAQVQDLGTKVSALEADHGLLWQRTDDVLRVADIFFDAGKEKRVTDRQPVKTGRHRAARNPHNFLVLRGGALGAAILGAVAGGIGGAAGAAAWLTGKTAPAMATAVRHPAAQMATAMLAAGAIVTVPATFASPHAPQPAILRQPSLSQNVVGTTRAHHRKGRHAARLAAPPRPASTATPSPSPSATLLPSLPALPLPSPSLPLPSPTDTGPPYGPPSLPGVPPVG